MMGLSAGVRIWLAAGVTDLRKGFEGLSAFSSPSCDTPRKQTRGASSKVCIANGYVVGPDHLRNAACHLHHGGKRAGCGASCRPRNADRHYDASGRIDLGLPDCPGDDQRGASRLDF